MRTKQGSYPARVPTQSARLMDDAPKPTVRPSSLVDTEDALREIDRFFQQDHAVIVALTAQEIQDEHIARNLP